MNRKKIQYLYIGFSLALVFSIAFACRPLNNPVDPKADNYQGYSTVSDISEVGSVFPADGNTIYYLGPFVWSEVLGAQQYDMQISSSDTAFESNIVFEKTDCSDNTVSVGSLPEGDYFYRVRSMEDSTWSDWSDVHSFTGDSRINADTIFPANGGTAPAGTTPMINWDEAPEVDGAGAAASYQVQLTDTAAAINSSTIIDASSSQYQTTTALTIGTTYYWRVRPVTSDGTPGFWSGVFSFTAVYSVGDTGPAGGIVFYDKGSYSDGWRWLEAAPASTEWSSIEWGAYGTDITGAGGTAVGTGKQNTADIIAYLGAGSTYAAQLCDGLTYGGYSDWFLPSKDELNLMYENLYLQGVGGFSDYGYWSSSEYSAIFAWGQGFGIGGQSNGDGKNGSERVRAARAF